MANPYELLPARAFWRLAVGQRDPKEITDLWKPKWPLSQEDRVATAGSCFAQHIGRALGRAGYTWYDAEPAPDRLPTELHAKFNYGVFSFRTGNIYTVALLRQWLSWASGKTTPPDEVWVEGGRYYDPFRPNIEPNGFASRKELEATRQATLSAIQRAVVDSNVFVFTLGLTEGWINKTDGYVYPMCPGTVAGSFDPKHHQFCNYRYTEIRADLEASLELMRSLNPNIRFLLTVSPVPLTATASPDHVLVATISSKSTLRAVAGDVAADRPDTDYFPSFEIISSFPFKGMFYDPNMRTVTRTGVDFVMQSFFAGLSPMTETGMERTKIATRADDAITTDPGIDDVVCEDILLAAFAEDSR